MVVLGASSISDVPQSANKVDKLADTPDAAEVVDLEHRRVDEERMRLNYQMSVSEDVLLERLR